MKYAERLQRQRCKACWNADGFDFHVPEDVWAAVVPPDLYDHVVCLRCFDDFARQRGIDYSRHLNAEVYFAGAQVTLKLQVVAATTCSRCSAASPGTDRTARP